MEEIQPDVKVGDATETSVNIPKLLLAQRGVRPVKRYPTLLLLEAKPGSLQLVVPYALARNLTFVTGGLAVLGAFLSSMGIAYWAGHSPFGFLPVENLNPDPFAGDVAAVELLIFFVVLIAIRGPWNKWHLRYLARHVESRMDLRVLRAWKGKESVTVVKHCVLIAQGEGTEFPLVVHGSLDEVDSALRLAGQVVRIANIVPYDSPPGPGAIPRS